MLRTKRSKIIFIITLFIIMVINQTLSPNFKKIIFLKFKRFTSIRTISDFSFINIGTKISKINDKLGKPDDSNYGQFSVDHQFYLFGGNSVVISVKIVENKEEDVFHVYYLEDSMDIDMGAEDIGFVLLTPTYKHKWLNTKDEPVRIKSKKILPKSGSEIPYNPDDWLLIYSDTSAYNYALDIKRDLKTGKLFIDMYTFKRSIGLQPGEMSGIKLKKDFSNIIECVEADAKKYKFTFKPIGEKEKCTSGNYKVALVISDCGYLWYRQNHDGTWSFKMSKVRNRDFDNDIIYNPKDANSGFNSKFIGFFEVGGIAKKYTEKGRYVDGRLQ